MVIIKFNATLFLLISICTLQVQAQKAIVACGGSATSSGGTVEYSIGQIDYTDNSNVAGSVNQGVQQPYPNSALPVTLLSFKATKVETKVLLQWETSTELNSKTFEVQRSENSTVFTKTIGQYAAAGNSNIIKKYSLIDQQTLKGWNYYRVKETDLDGKFIYTKIVAVNFDLPENIAVVYPNPTTDNVVLNITNFASNTLSYQLYDLSGKLLFNNKINDSQTIIALKTLPLATYNLKIVNENTTTKTFKIIKSK